MPPTCRQYQRSARNSPDGETRESRYSSNSRRPRSRAARRAGARAGAVVLFQAASAWVRFSLVSRVQRRSAFGSRKSPIPREDDRLRARPDAELVEHVRDVISNRLIADGEPVRNIRVAESIRQQEDNIAIPRRMGYDGRII